MVIRSDFDNLKSSLETKCDSVFKKLYKALDTLSNRVSRMEETCKGVVNPCKQRHEDPDSDPYEGEKEGG